MFILQSMRRPHFSLTTHSVRARAYGSAKLINCSNPKSAELLLNSLNQNTLEMKISALKDVLRDGVNINAKLKSYHTHLPGVSVLKFVDYETPDDQYAQLTEFLLQNGAKVDDEDYQEGSPLHDALFYCSSFERKTSAIKIYTKWGVHVNQLNKQMATPLDYCWYFNSNIEMKDDLNDLLRQKGAIHGFSYTSPERLFPVISVPGSLAWMSLTKIEAVLCSQRLFQRLHAHVEVE